LANLADLPINGRDCRRIGSAKEVECAGKTKQTVVICRMSLLVGRRGGTAVICLLQAQGMRKFVDDRSLGWRRTHQCEQERLRDQRINRGGANQLSQEAKPRTRLI
jgi:hypothetical protein